MLSKTILFWGIVFVLVGWMGCATHRVDPARPRSRPLGDDFPVFRPPAKPDDSPQGTFPTEEPSGALTLRQALALALMNNPDLAAFSWEIRAQEAATLQAGLHSNPEIAADMQDINGSGASIDGVRQPQTTLQISQLIEMGGKRSKRREVASLTRDLAGWDYETKRIDIFTQISQAFIDVLSAQQNLALTEETVRLAEQVAEVVSERVTAGKVSPVEEAKANVALSSAEIELDRARRELEAARNRLAATWGGATPRFERAEGDLGPVSPIPSLAQIALRLSQNPDLARWAAEISQRRAVIDLEKSKAIPDINLMGGYRRYNTSDDGVFIVGISLPLPIFNRNQGGIREARDRLAKGKEERRAAEARVAAGLAEAYKSLSSAHAEVTALREKILPRAQSAFDAVNEGYRLGKFGLLDVLDAQRTFFSSRAQHLRALTDYHQAVAEIERLIGERLESGGQGSGVGGR
ncbi:MAG TPA: TolC family protein [Candidatus Manganitrophaceae bacterium]|nr:TolC family protein [Candidatus Manganitrophaceae bacterium]